MIDRDHLMRQTGGDDDLQHDVLTIFVEQMRAFASMLAAASDRPADRRLAEAFHRFRGAASAIGAAPLVAALAEAERASAQATIGPATLETLRKLAADAHDDAAGIIAARERPGLAKGGESH